MNITIRTISIVLTLLLSSTSIIVADQKRTAKQEKAAMMNFNIQRKNSIGKYAFPLTVKSFVKDLGLPDVTHIDSGSESNTCPTGQHHTWCLEYENLAVSVLGDDYTEKVNYDADSRLFLVKQCNPSNTTSFQGLWGIKLGEPARSVKAKLEQIIKNRKAYNLSLLRSDPVFPFGAGTVYNYLLTNGTDLYFFFGIDERGHLFMIIQANFDPRGAC